MDETAKTALEKLLVQAERANGRSESDHHTNGRPRAIRLQLNECSFPAYTQLATFTDKKACNGTLKVAERVGAIRIKWDLRAGLDASVESVELQDADGLARFLGVVPRWDIVTEAESAFSPRFQRFPVLRSLLDAWRQGRSVRSSKASAAAIEGWLDAAAVVEHAAKNAAEGGADIALRRASTQLFDDSKRIESIAHLVDVLVQGSIDAVARETEEVCQELGLQKYPSAFLVGSAMSSGCSAIAKLRHGELPLLQPYVGFSPTELQHLAIRAARTMVITVENLTTFHEAAHMLQDKAPDSAVLILYTAGMPSPSWRLAYKAILASIAPESSVFHWGDVDAGGFRIVDKLAYDCAATGRSLRLHLMDIDPPKTRKSLSDREVRTISSICERWSWDNEATAVRTHKCAFEQEAVRVALPCG